MKIQYKSEPLAIKSEKRYLLYRIDPSELSWWKRTFKNPWRYAYSGAHSVVYSTDERPSDCLTYLFSAKEADEFIKKYDTYEKLIDFLAAQYDNAKTKYYNAQMKYKNENDRWNF